MADDASADVADQRGRREPADGERGVHTSVPRARRRAARASTIVHRRDAPDRHLPGTEPAPVGGAVSPRFLVSRRRPVVHQREGPRRIGPARTPGAHEAMTEHGNRRSILPLDAPSCVGTDEANRPLSERGSTSHARECPTGCPDTTQKVGFISPYSHVVTDRCAAVALNFATARQHAPAGEPAAPLVTSRPRARDRRTSESQSPDRPTLAR